MANTTSPTLLGRMHSIAEENRALNVKVAALEGELETLRARAMAEDVLVKAAAQPEPPRHLACHTLQEFLDKRAHLEAQGPKQIQKVAAATDFFLSGAIPDMLLSDSPDQDDEQSVFGPVLERRRSMYGT